MRDLVERGHDDRHVGLLNDRPQSGGQSLQVFASIHVGQHRQRTNAQARRAGPLERLGEYRFGTPGDVGKHVRPPAQADQPVAAVGTGAQGQVADVQRREGLAEMTRRKLRTVRPHQHDLAAPRAERLLKCPLHSLAHVAGALGRIRHVSPQPPPHAPARCTRAAHLDLQGRPPPELPCRIEHRRRHLTLQPRRPHRPDCPNQPRLGPAGHGIARKDDQATDNVAAAGFARRIVTVLVCCHAPSTIPRTALDGKARGVGWHLQTEPAGRSLWVGKQQSPSIRTHISSHDPPTSSAALRLKVPPGATLESIAQHVQTGLRDSAYRGEASTSA